MPGSQERPPDRPSVNPSPAAEVLLALRALRNGGLDDSARALDLGPAVATSLSAVLAALRWGAVMIGVAWAAAGATSGDLAIVLTLTMSVFLASWRTVRPIRLGDPNPLQRTVAFSDVAVLAAAVGISEGLTSPFIGCVLVAVAIVGFGWGLHDGMWAATLAFATTFVVTALTHGAVEVPSALGVIALSGAALIPGIAQQRLLHMEHRRQSEAERMGRLTEANQLLEVLNEVTRTLPSSLDLEEALATARSQLLETFEPDRLILLTVEDGTWSPQIQQGFDLPPTFPTHRLPAPLGHAASSGRVLLIDDLVPTAGRRGAGLYARLVVDGVDVGVVAVERRDRSFTPNDAELLTGMAEILALTVANARSFARLRSLAAAEERTRIARDLHDRLGQWLTYIGLELERINSTQVEPSLELKQLHEDTQGAIAELRDTLIELRAAVGPDRPLSVLLGEVVDRFKKRSTIDVTLVVPDDRTIRLPAVTENELLRIAQEALTNVEKHAMATHAHVGWTVENGRGVLVIQDDGRGFDPAKGIRGTAYGLVGMRERAASVGAILEVTSEPDQGTVITVLTSQPPREALS